MLTKEEYLKILEGMAFVEGFMNLEHVLKYDGAIALKYKVIYQLIEEHFKLLDSRDRWKEIAHNLDEALREYQRKYGE